MHAVRRIISHWFLVPTTTTYYVLRKPNQRTIACKTVEEVPACTNDLSKQLGLVVKWQVCPSPCQNILITVKHLCHARI